MKKLCIYHGNCADGFTAAWVVRNFLGEDNVDFHAGVYGVSPPDVTDRHVIMVDFSYKRPVILEMAANAATIIIIDHHKTAQEDLVDLPKNVLVYFDMEHSGAMLTWLYFEGLYGQYKGGANPLFAPEIIKRVEDRDLWHFKFADTREIQANIFSHEYTFENWDKLATTSMEELAKEGRAIERKHFKDIKELLAITKRRLNIGGYNVPAASLPYTLSSDAGHAMGEGEPFAVCYWDTPTGRTFSLRSSNIGVDVSNIAKQYGGGGHAHAAGFSVSYDVARTFEPV